MSVRDLAIEMHFFGILGFLWMPLLPRMVLGHDQDSIGRIQNIKEVTFKGTYAIIGSSTIQDIMDRLFKHKKCILKAIDNY